MKLFPGIVLYFDRERLLELYGPTWRNLSLWLAFSLHAETALCLWMSTCGVRCDAICVTPEAKNTTLSR